MKIRLTILLITVLLSSSGYRAFGRDIYTDPRLSDVPALIEALKDKDIDIRLNAAYALGDIGPAAKDALPALKQRLGIWSAYAISQINPDDETGIAYLFASRVRGGYVSTWPPCWAAFSMEVAHDCCR